MNYQYQLIALIAVDPEPPIGTPVYGGGPTGWLPNVTVKRRFAVNGIDEEGLRAKLEYFCSQHKPFTITFTRALKPAHMPVQVIEVAQDASLMSFHAGLIAYLGETIQSKFPEREGLNYYPHMTTTWQGEEVVDSEKYLSESGHSNPIQINRLCLIKDVTGKNSQVVKYFDIRG